MTATDAQIRIAMGERTKDRTQQRAAAKANLRSRKTFAKYERVGRLPSELKQIRTYQTHPDAFADNWPTVQEMLTEAPELEAKALFDWLCAEHPGCYQEGQLRTFQRRVSDWRAIHVPKILSLLLSEQAFGSAGASVSKGCGPGELPDAEAVLAKGFHG